MSIFMPRSKLRKYIRNATLVLCTIALAQVGFNITNAIRNTKLYKTPAYSSNEILKTEFEKEKKKLSLENLSIELEVVNDTNNPDFIGQCVYNYDGRYNILVGESYKTRGVLRHELYHAYRIYNSHIKKARIKFSPKDTYEDWKATSYGLKED